MSENNDIDVASPRSEEIMDKLFGSESQESDRVEDTVDDEIEDTVEDEIEDTEEESDDTDSTDDDIDYDEVLSKDDDQEDEQEESPRIESKAREQAKIRGREAKELKAKLTEKDLELARVTKELEEKKSRLEEVEATQIKPFEHPDYVSARETILSDVRVVSRRLPGETKTLLVKKFGFLMDAFLEASEVPSEKAAEADEKLTGAIVDNLKLSDVPYEEMDEDERSAAMPTVDRIMGLLERNSEKTRDLQNLYTKLESRAKTGKLSVGYKEYENKTNEFKPIIDKVGDVPDEVLEAKPHSIEAIVAKLIKSSPEAKKRFEKAQKDVLDVLVGPRVLTQDDIDKLEANGTDIKEYLVERDRLHQTKLKKLAPMFVQALVTRAEFSKYVEKASKASDNDDEAETEFDAVQKASRKRVKLDGKKAKEDPRKRDPLAGIFGPSEEDDW
jgi:hypothetical protein